MGAPIRSKKRITQAVAEYLDCGNKAEVARRLGVSEPCIAAWTRRPEWAEAYNDLAKVIDEDAKTAYRLMLRNSQARILERLDEGDPYVVQGEVTYAPVRARDAAVISAIAFDKLRLIEGKPTRITSDSSQALELLKKFEEMGRAYRQGNVIEQQPVSRLPTVTHSPNVAQPVDISTDVPTNNT